MRDRGTNLPIWIGIPGLTDNRRLLRISLKIPGSASRPASSKPTAAGWRACCARAYSPTKLLLRLAPTIADPAARIGGLHVYRSTSSSARRTGAASSSRS